MISSKNFFKTAYRGVSTKIISAILGVTLSILLARLLGPGDYGIYVLYINIINTMVVLIMIGLPQLITREVAKKYNERGGCVNKSIYKKAFKMTLYSSAIFFPVFIGSLFMLDLKINLVIYLIIIVLFIGLSQLNSSVIRGSHKPIIADIPLLIIKPAATLLLILILYKLYNSINIINIFSIVLFSTLLSALISFIILKKLDFIEEKSVNITGIKGFYFISIIGVLEMQIPIFALSILESSNSVAFYQIGLQLVSLIVFVILSINNQLSSRVSEAFYNKNMKYLQSMLNNSLKFSFYYILLAVFISLFIIYNIDLFYGKEYIEVFGVSMIILLSQIINVMLGSSALVMNMSGNQSITLKMMIVSILINLVGCIILIPILSYYGATISALLAMFFWKSSLSYICYKKFGVKTYFRAKVLQ